MFSLAVLMGLISAATSIVVKQIARIIMGPDRAEADELRKRADQAKVEYDKADEKVKEATARDNKIAIALAVRELNLRRDELRRLRDEVIAKRG